jgi:hypothetical protein
MPSIQVGGTSMPVAEHDGDICSDICSAGLLSVAPWLVGATGSAPLHCPNFMPLTGCLDNCRTGQWLRDGSVIKATACGHQY